MRVTLELMLENNGEKLLTEINKVKTGPVVITKKESLNQKKFLLLVKNFLCINSFYSLDEFYNFS